VGGSSAAKLLVTSLAAIKDGVATLARRMQMLMIGNEQVGCH
jgi:hypothetical protein